MKIELPVQEKQALAKRHRTERDGRVRDRIKAVLLKSEGWINEAIAQALRTHVERSLTRMGSGTKTQA